MGVNFNEISYKLKENIFKNKQNEEITKYNTKIKSLFVIKKVLSHLSIIKKLDIIKYNNKLRNDLGYKIDDYKKLCRRYILGTKKWKSKRIYNEFKNIIIWREYKNGKRNGKGKEYYNNGKLKFNGEYFNDEIIEGKGYDINNNMILLIEKNGEGL